jgi:hypothetical protein
VLNSVYKKELFTEHYLFVTLLIVLNTYKQSHTILVAATLFRRVLKASALSREIDLHLEAVAIIDESRMYKRDVKGFCLLNVVASLAHVHDVRQGV